jgi:hypothetical protein
MAEFLSALLSTGLFMPQGHCYLWMPELVWLHVITDGLIAVAYYAMPLTLAFFVHRRNDLPFSWMFLLFGAFIIACGTTHIMAVWTLWHPTYWLAGGVKAISPVAAGDLRAVRRAHPDLIVGRQGALFEGLSLIAPTVIVEPGSGRWKLNLRLMGEALGRTNDAEALLTAYDRRVAAVRSAVRGRPRVAVVRPVEDGWRVAPRD